MSNLIPTPIIDKNGRATTVLKRPEDSATINRVSGAPAPSKPPTKPVMSAKSGDMPARLLEVGQTVEMTYGIDFSDVLEKNDTGYMSDEVRAFRYIQEHDVTGKITYLGEFAEGESEIVSYSSHRQYKFELTDEDGNTFEGNYHAGMGVALVPSITDVIESLASDVSFSQDVDSFEDFLKETGTELYSAKEEKIERQRYKRYQEEMSEFASFVGDADELDKLVYG